MLTLEQLKAVFAEWDRRAAEGKWAGNPPDPEASAQVFTEITFALFPHLNPVVKLGDVKAGDSIHLDAGFTCSGAVWVTVHADEESGELWFPCRDGRHYLEGQVDHGDTDELTGIVGHMRQSAP